MLAPYSGDELVYNATLGDWRTHNGVDAAAAAGDEVPAVKGGRVTVVEDDALWGGVVEIVDANGCTWRYCGVTPGCVVGGDVAAGEIEGVLTELAGRLLITGRADPEAARDALLHTMACKAAVKGGQRNGPQELQRLAEAVMDGTVKYCPHGRPVAIELTRQQLEKRFGRA